MTNLGLSGGSMDPSGPLLGSACGSSISGPPPKTSKNLRCNSELELQHVIRMPMYVWLNTNIVIVTKEY